MDIFKKRIVIAIISIFFILVVGLGFSYAHFSTQVVGNNQAKEIALKNINLEVMFSDGEEVNINNFIPGGTANKTFLVENAASQEFSYTLVWTHIANGVSDPSLLTYTVECVAYSDYLTKTISSSPCFGKSEATVPNSSMETVSIIPGVAIPANDTHEYTVTFEVDSAIPKNEYFSFTGSFGIIGGNIVDATPPEDAEIIYEDGYVKDNEQKVKLHAKDDETAIKETKLKRKEANLHDGICGTYGEYVVLGTPAAEHNPAIVSGKCYKYQQEAMNNFGLITLTDADPEIETKVDTNAPTSNTININGGAANTTSRYVTLTLGSTDNESGLDKMCISNTTTCYNWVNYSTTKSWVLSYSLGTATVYVTYKDRAGNISSRVSDTIYIDSIPPTNNSIIIDSGASYTSSTSVNLAISSTGATQMCISNSPTCSSWEAYSSSKSWTLTSGQNGYRFVYASFKDAYGNQTYYYIYDYIIYSIGAPTNNSIIINGNSTYTTSTNVSLNLGSSGAIQMCISNTTSCSAWEPYTTYKSWTLPLGGGTKTVYAWFRDGALNTTSMVSDTIILDNTYPISLSINYTDGFVNSVSNSISFSASDPESGIKDYSLFTRNVSLSNGVCGSFGNSYWSIFYQNSSVTSPYSAYTTDGFCHQYFIMARNGVGYTSVSNPSKTIKVDTTPPTCNVTGGSSEWTNGSRTVTAFCNDSQSGCTGNLSYIYTTQINTTTAGAQGAGNGGSVSNQAGLITSCPPNQTVRIDKTPPTCNVTGGSSDWTNGYRTITATCYDSGGSNCGITSFQYTYSTEMDITTAGARGNNDGGSVFDNAYNLTSCPAYQIVRIDKTLPTCSPVKSNLYTIDGVRITLNASDSGGSGLLGSYGPYVDVKTTQTYYINDYAGNTYGCNVAVSTAVRYRYRVTSGPYTGIISSYLYTSSANAMSACNSFIGGDGTCTTNGATVYY